MKRILIGILMVFVLSTLSIAAEPRETEEQAVMVAQTGLIHGELSLKSITDMIKYFEQAVDISDGSTKFKEYAKEALIHAKEALAHLQEALKYANESARIKIEKK